MLTDEQLKTIEHTLAGIAVFLVFVCTVGGPHVNWGPTREQLLRSHIHVEHRVARLQSSLQSAEGHVNAQKAELAAAGSSLATLKSQIGALQKERDAANKQTSDEAAKIKELESQLQAAKAEIAKLKDDSTKSQLEAAVARANKAEDRIRELTLQLHNAGIWP